MTTRKDYGLFVLLSTTIFSLFISMVFPSAHPAMKPVLWIIIPTVLLGSAGFCGSIFCMNFIKYQQKIIWPTVATLAGFATFIGQLAIAMSVGLSLDAPGLKVNHALQVFLILPPLLFVFSFIPIFHRYTPE